MRDVTGLWISGNEYLIRHKRTGRTDKYTIPEPQLYDRFEMDEIIDAIEQMAEKELAIAAPERKPHTKGFRLDLGRQLMSIKASQQFMRDNNHGRYWPGVK